MKKIAAIIGSGPCLEDVTHRRGLSEKRTCFYLNGAPGGFLPKGIPVFQKWISLLRAFKTLDLEKTDYLLVGRDTQNELARTAGTEKEAAFLLTALRGWVYFDERASFPVRVPQDCSLLFCLAFLSKFPIYDEIELYGCDVSEEPYLHHRAKILTFIDDHIDVPVRNCCPSSGLRPDVRFFPTIFCRSEHVTDRIV